jgi:dolichyl-diphosphooligosaccharide---protein glycosyltransferase
VKKCSSLKLSLTIIEIHRGPAGFDRTRNAVIGNKDFDLTYLEEAYTSEHWLVRIYRVKKPHEFNRPALKSDERVVSSGDYITKKVRL